MDRKVINEKNCLYARPSNGSVIGKVKVTTGLQTAFSTIFVCCMGLAMVFFLTSSAYGLLPSIQQPISGFKTYENPDYNIQIQYPKSWKKSEVDLPANTIVKFIAPDTKSIVEPASLLISNFQMPNVTTLDEFVEFFFNDRYSKPTDYKLLSTQDTKLENMSAKQFVLYDYDKDKILGTESTGKVMRILAIDNITSNAYSIKYWAQPSLYNKYLPNVEQMIGSFQTISLVSTPQSEGNAAPQAITNNGNQSQKIGTPSITDYGSPNPNSNPNPNQTATTGEVIDLSKLPDFLTVSTDNEDLDFPLVGAIGKTSSAQGQKIIDLADTVFEINDWNPKFTFQFAEGSNAPLQNVKRILIGQLKSYNSVQDALKNVKVWKDIPLNQQVVLRLDHKDMNYMIVEVDYANGLFGLYSSVFNNKPFGSKQTDFSFLKDDLKANKDLKVMPPSKVDLNRDILVWEAVTPTICNDLKDFGFRVCKSH